MRKIGTSPLHTAVPTQSELWSFYTTKLSSSDPTQVHCPTLSAYTEPTYKCIYHCRNGLYNLTKVNCFRCGW